MSRPTMTSAQLAATANWQPEIPTPIRDFQVTDGRYRLSLLPPGVSFSLQRVRRERHELVGELAVHCDLPGAAITTTGALMTADFNLSSARARVERAKLLDIRAHTAGKLDWQGYLEEFIEHVFEHERAGEPVVNLAEVATRSGPLAYRVAGFELFRKHPVVLFGHGGSGKSWLALYFAGLLQAQGVKVLYADWELEREDQTERLRGLFPGQAPAVSYIRCTSPLVYQTERMRGIIQRERIGYVILDSAAVGCVGSANEDAGANGYFTALRELNIGSLIIAHMAGHDQGDQKPFGSVFWHNNARSTWFVKQAEQTAENLISVGCYQRKTNFKKRGVVGFDLAFTDVVNREWPQVEIRSSDVNDSPDLAAKQTIFERMRGALRRGPMTLEALAAQLEEKETSVSAKARKYRNVFNRILGADGKTLLSLVERRIV